MDKSSAHYGGTPSGAYDRRVSPSCRTLGHRARAVGRFHRFAPIRAEHSRPHARSVGRAASADERASRRGLVHRRSSGLSGRAPLPARKKARGFPRFETCLWLTTPTTKPLSVHRDLTLDQRGRDRLSSIRQTLPAPLLAPGEFAETRLFRRLKRGRTRCEYLQHHRRHEPLS